MLRTIGAIFSGFAAFVLVVAIATYVARAGWTAYAAVEKQRAFTLGMLLSRQVVAMVATLAAGATAIWVDRGAKQAALMFGVLLLLISVVWHYRIWDQYPVWYHLTYFAYIVPLAVLGGKLVKLEVAR